jgi:hypothetical protein
VQPAGAHDVTCKLRKAIQGQGPVTASTSELQRRVERLTQTPLLWSGIANHTSLQPVAGVMVDAVMQHGLTTGGPRSRTRA